MKPMFSIVVPVYNAEKYLKKCVDNLISQTYQNIEIILINDGSKDGSQQICEEYVKDKRVILISKENAGVSKARNDGINRAQGDYIIFVDSDDVPSTNICEEYFNILKEKEYDLIISDVRKVNENDVYVNSFGNIMENGNVSIDILKNKINDIYIYGALNCPYSKCFKKEKIVDLYDSNLSLGEDLLFNLKYLVNCESIYYLNKELYKYVLYKQNSLSTKYREDNFGNISRVYKESLNILTKFLNVEEDFLTCIHKKYVLDCIVILERIARNKGFDKVTKINKISENYLECLDIYNFKCNLINGLKWKIYYLILRKKNYKLFIYFSNFIKRRK